MDPSRLSNFSFCETFKLVSDVERLSARPFSCSKEKKGVELTMPRGTSEDSPGSFSLECGPASLRGDPRRSKLLRIWTQLNSRKLDRFIRRNTNSFDSRNCWHALICSSS